MRAGTLLRWHALKNILKYEVKGGLTILDIGGYDGHISYNLKRMFPSLQIIVVDIDRSGLKLAKKRGLMTVCASVLDLPIKNNKIDVVLCFDIIEHIEENDRLFKEISRVLKKNGKLILTTPMQDGVTFPFLSKKKIETVNRNWGHVCKGYFLEKIKLLFESNNMDIVRMSGYFNFISRLVYRVIFLSVVALKGNNLLWRNVVRLEPYVKCGRQVHIIVGKKIRL